MPLAWVISNTTMGEFIRWMQKAIMGNKKRCPEEERCLELARLMLDEQATEEEANYVKKHIDGCFRCYDNYDLEKAIREAVKLKTRKEKLSVELKEEIERKILI